MSIRAPRWERTWLTTYEVRQALGGVSNQAVVRWIREGALPAATAPNGHHVTYLVHQSDLKQFAKIRKGGQR